MYEILATYLLYLLQLRDMTGPTPKFLIFNLKSDFNELKFYIEPDVKINTSSTIFLKN